VIPLPRKKPSIAAHDVYANIVGADSTLRVYESCWRAFAAWCKTHKRNPLPAAPTTIAAYIDDLATQGRAAATIAKYLAAISVAHRTQEQQPVASGIVKLQWKRIRRRIGTAQHGKRALLVNDIRRIIQALPDDLTGLRDRAVLLFGIASACRRSELAALNIEDLIPVPEGFILNIRKSKTDQEAAGIEKGIPYGQHHETCPVLAIQAWQKAGGFTSGPLFRKIRDGRPAGRMRGDEIAAVIKGGCALAGLDPKLFAGHSLRVGFVTEMGLRRVPLANIMAQTGHKDERMIRRYTRKGTLFLDNPAAQLGL
jgi:integrase